MRKIKKIITSFLLILILFANNIHSQTAVFSDVEVSDFGNSNGIGSANTSRNVATDSNGNIYVVYANGTEIRLAKSINNGESFLPSILIANSISLEPEINVSQSNIIYIAWTENTSVFFTKSVNLGDSFSNARVIGDSIAGNIHIASYANNIYLINQQGKKLFSNDNNGTGNFNEINTGVSMVYADVLIDLNGIVYTPMDNPDLLLFESTDQGQSLTSTTLIPSGKVYFSSYALSDSPNGTFIFVAGGDLDGDPTVPSTSGYRINTKTGVLQTITFGKNTITPEGRTLYADNKGALIDGYRADNGDLMISVSANQGISFETPIVVANGGSHNIARSSKTNHVLVVYEKNGSIFLSTYTDVLKNIEITTPSPISLCSSENFDISFKLFGDFDQNTLFVASLSDENGNFTNTIEIGSVRTNTDGIINCNLPANLVSSGDYRIQIESASNFLQSNPINLQLKATSIAGDFNICLTETTQLIGGGTPRISNPWASSNSAIATIDNNGIVTAVASGIVKISYFTNDGCTSEIDFQVFDLPIINSNVTLNQCDNDSDGFSSFNLNEVKEKIVTNKDNYTITFFEEKNLAENNSSPIQNSTAYINEIASNDIICARVENNNGCLRISEVNLIISTTQIPLNFSKIFYECDDGVNLNDGIATFDFSSVTNDIINIFPTNQQLDITYYKNENDALAEENKITNVDNYQNTSSPNQQTIYIRVDSKVDNSCLGLGAHITLNVENVPVANMVNLDPECDNDRDGLFSFDTSAIQSTIIGSQNNVAVSYFDETGNQLSSPLPNPFITDSQKITARITNTNSQDKDGQCYDETTIDFVVNTVPIANPILPLEVCDDDFDGITNFDTSTIENTILGSQTGLIVKYFDENNNTLPSPLPNPFASSTQTIKVRLENPIYDVCFEETTIDFIVNEKPSFNLITDDIICMDNNPRLGIQIDNPLGNYSYTWRDESNVIVGTTAAVDVFEGGVYSVIATSDKGCNSDELSIRIRESSISTININDIEVQDDSENNFIRINTQNLGLGDYEFRLLDENSNILFDYQDDTLFENLEGGIYTVEVNDKNNCGSQTFEIALISFPKFFTPNSDNQNDFWQIKGISKSFYKSGIITVLIDMVKWFLNLQ
ncbi:Ig-like domain-containing protein [Polaribacter porphyrae]|uniref:BIG2 domain-containing protein n=1 Tax=Polaribacter porphyrae TaxID=1137780 RepID=A0A2S7WQ00_9FLAO|nr:Ig-like domain-containing protein [Polaribacter porphyrae]PQJ79690.1 hypothetical protein BTO18_11120 [Polaribacter porphyrae]